MSYTDAPATKMLATHCAACGRPLVDSASVEAGMGPDCRAKYGAPELDDATRAEANKLVYQIALDQTGPTVATALIQLRQLGCHTLADRITKRLASAYAAVITADGTELLVKTRYEEGLVRAIARIPGRRWDKDNKANRIPANQRPALWGALQSHLAGCRGLGPRGEFIIPGAR
jgi:hypothetical protein